MEFRWLYRGDCGLAAGEVHVHVAEAVNDLQDDLFPMRLRSALPEEVGKKGQIDLAASRGEDLDLHDVLEGHPSLVDQIVHVDHRPSVSVFRRFSRTRPRSMVESAGSGGIFDVAVVAGEFALFSRAESADERGRY